LVGFDPNKTTGENETLRDALGPLHYEPLLVAIDRHAAYYSDDVTQRSLAALTYKVPTFNTQAMLRTAKERGKITEDEYQDAIITLFIHNYDYVSDDGGTLYRLASRENFAISIFAEKLLVRAVGPKTNREGALIVLSEFLIRIWKADLSNSKSTRNDWIWVCLKLIAKTSDRNELMVQLIVALAYSCLVEPETFGGVVSAVVRYPDVTQFWGENDIISAVQHTIEARIIPFCLKYVWARDLLGRWRDLHRLNDMLLKNGWLP
jgi:hypothetical protein